MGKVNGDGSIVQLEKDKPKGKCRKWQLRACCGKNISTGKYQTKTRRFEGTYTEAKAALRAFIDEVEHNKIQGRTKYTFEEYVYHYIEVREAKKEVAPTTLQRQKSQFQAVNRLIGQAQLESITPAMLNDVYIAMLKGGIKSGKPASGSYVNQIHDNIRLVFAFAIKEGLLVSNPCDAAAPPKMDTKPKKAIRPEKIHEFINMLDPTDSHECAYLLAITMGLRRGEICGLSWSDIDFERRIVDVSHSYDVLGNLKETKTKAGMRLLPLSTITYNALVTMKEAQFKQFQKTNSFRKPEEGYLVQDESSPVIATHYGQRLLPTSLSRWWTLERHKYGLDDYSFHEMRHSYLTLLAISGVHPKVMQELAGHYSSQITMDIYTHVNLDAKRDAVEAVEHIF